MLFDLPHFQPETTACGDAGCHCAGSKKSGGLTNSGVMGVAGGVIGVTAFVVGTITYLTIRRMDAEYAKTGTVQGKAHALVGSTYVHPPCTRPHPY